MTKTIDLDSYKPAQRRVLEILLEHGVAPDEVIAGGSDENGYTRFVRTSEGKLIPDDDSEYGALTASVNWPEGFPVEEFLAAEDAFFVEMDANFDEQEVGKA